MLPLITTIRIDWSDLDSYEHVNNVSIIRFLQSARVTFWERSGLYESFEKHKKGPILVSTKCDFKKELHYPGTVTIHTKVSRIGNSSFQLHHFLQNESDDLCAEGFDTAVCYNFNTKEKYTIPDALRDFMKQHLE